jgi:hypothetical protein
MLNNYFGENFIPSSDDEERYKYKPHIKEKSSIYITLFLTPSPGSLSCLQGYVACELVPAILYNLRPSP